MYTDGLPRNEGSAVANGRNRCHKGDLPPVKAIEQPQAISLPANGTLTAHGRAVLRAVAAGELAPTHGASLLGAIGTLACVTEVDELAARITVLEAQHGDA